MVLWVKNTLEMTLDTMCSFIGLPETFEYNSAVGELGFALFKFDQQSALKSRRGKLKALDASYDFNAYTMYNWFTASSPGELCLQIHSQQYGQVMMRGAYLGNSQARLQVTIYERGERTRHTMGELSGQTIATFDVNRDTYYSN